MQNRQPLHVGLQPFRLSRRFSADNPGRRCSRSELGATPQGREEFRELAAWYTNLESSHHYANRPVLSTVTASGMDRELALLPDEFRRRRYAQCCPEV